MQYQSRTATVLPGDPLQYFQTTPHEPCEYTVQCHASQGFDWSLRHLANSTVEQINYTTQLGLVIAAENRRSAYAPRVSHMSALVYPQQAFTLGTDICRGVTLWRTLGPSDGVVLPSNGLFVMSAGGCPALVLTARSFAGTSICIVAHAGLASLIDEGVLAGHAPREHASVVAAMVEAACGLSADPFTLTLRSFYAIPWEAFPRALRDRRHGEKNAVVVKHLETHWGNDVVKRSDGTEFVCLTSLIEAQAEAAGIPRVEARGYELPLNGRYAYTSHHNPALGGLVRNLVLVKR